MKEVFFNKQTLCQPLVTEDDAKTRVENYARVVKTAGEKGYKKVRYDVSLDEILLTEAETLKTYCAKHSRDVNCLLLLTTARHPYIDDDDNEKLEKYVLSDFKLIANGVEYDDLCFGAACLSESFLVGFKTNDVWCHLKYTIRGQVSDKGVEQDLFCVVSEEQYGNSEFSIWLDRHDFIDESCIEKSTLLPTSKTISLRDDHGKNILNAHAEKLRNSPYVIKIVNSTSFKPTAKHYIDKVKENGLIEIVLTKTDKGLGMVVQTTGRNLKETLWIAKELERKYGE